MDNRIKDICILAVLALVLVFASWKIFGSEKEVEETVSALSQTEEKISRLLEEMEGVGEASVMICETEEGVQSAVVVCEGANDLQVIMDIREAVASALGTKEKAVKVYLKKE
ncbi:MAG: hypothetical protein IJ996_02615 [Clostridia bacterium]|nr:hypothetical protein [Clostridia bacterium]